MSDQHEQSPSRRRLIKSFAVIPIAVAGAAGVIHAVQKPAEAAETSGADPYQPSFFKASEWAFINAACDRLIPHDEHGPGAVELGVPEFLDRHMQTPYAAGDIWYMQGPFLEAAPEFGYQGKLNLREIIQVGIKQFDVHCVAQFGGKTFAQLTVAQQVALLKDAEGGKLKLEHISAKLFFNNFLNEVRNGYFADPKYGGNKGMGAWKMIGYPGMRADYLDWVTVRDKPYPLGPVDLAGKRG